MSQHKCENTQKTSAPEPTPSQCQCTTDHKNHQNYIPDSSLGLFFNLTLLFAELGKNTYAWANRGKMKNRIAILSAQWVAWENRKSWGFLGCQTPTDGNVAPLTLPTAQLKCTKGYGWERHPDIAKMWLETCEAKDVSETPLGKVLLDWQWKGSQKGRFPKIHQ